jgi:hypothetical protein
MKCVFGSRHRFSKLSIEGSINLSLALSSHISVGVWQTSNELASFCSIHWTSKCTYSWTCPARPGMSLTALFASTSCNTLSLSFCSTSRSCMKQRHHQLHQWGHCHPPMTCSLLCSLCEARRQPPMLSGPKGILFTQTSHSWHTYLLSLCRSPPNEHPTSVQSAHHSVPAVAVFFLRASWLVICFVLCALWLANCHFLLGMLPILHSNFLRWWIPSFLFKSCNPELGLTNSRTKFADSNKLPPTASTSSHFVI